MASCHIIFLAYGLQIKRQQNNFSSGLLDASNYQKVSAHRGIGGRSQTRKRRFKRLVLKNERLQEVCTLFDFRLRNINNNQNYCKAVVKFPPSPCSFTTETRRILLLTVRFRICLQSINQGNLSWCSLIFTEFSLIFFLLRRFCFVYS